MAPLLGYWNIRGLAQPIRLLLAYAEKDFEEKRYEEENPSPGRDWKEDKFSLDLDFPNLPYYVDGDVRITQSNAILRFLGRKHGLCGKNEEQRIRIDVLENEAMDLRNGFVKLCYSPDFADLREVYVSSLPAKLGSFSTYLGGRDWFADSLSYVDFILYERLDQHKHLEPACLREFPNLEEFQRRFESLPEIKEYMESGRFLRWPINGRESRFGH